MVKITFRFLVKIGIILLSLLVWFFLFFLMFIPTCVRAALSVELPHERKN
ncbi:MAG TPA: hypothetical protein VKK79_19095 [Candidatus Lokiarchaeia archaeon]|nr:hypothetical protein [Candidatus Lokiarchaeia archaeon]